MADYTDPIRAALFAVLDGDDTLGELATGGVWHLRAEAEAAFPYCVFNKQSGLPIRAMGAVAFVNQLWLVKGLCRGSDQGEAEAIDARCEQLLDGAALAIEGFELLGCERETDVVFPEDDSGETIFHCGALYRLRAQPL
jgi:Protein of unknown function (DUF3168)